MPRAHRLSALRGVDIHVGLWTWSALTRRFPIRVWDTALRKRSRHQQPDRIAALPGPQSSRTTAGRGGLGRRPDSRMLAQPSSDLGLRCGILTYVIRITAFRSRDAITSVCGRPLMSER